MTPESSWSYFRDKTDNINDNASDGKSLKYKTKIIGKAPAQPGNEGDANRPTLNVKAHYSTKISIVFRDFLIYH